MLNQPQDNKVLDAIYRLKRDSDFGILIGYLSENLPYIARQSVYSSGVVSDEYSGAYKILEELLYLCSLEEYKDPAVVDRHFE